MSYSRFIRFSIVCASIAVVAACGKEPAAPSPSQSAPSASAPAPAPAPAPATPAESAPAPSSAAPTSAPSSASGKNAQELAGKNGCLACHAVDKKLVGPSYKDIAAKYAGQPDAEGKLMQKVKNGGSGVWGSVPMPPNPQVSDQDVKTLVDWILSLK